MVFAPGGQQIPCNKQGFIDTCNKIRVSETHSPGQVGVKMLVSMLGQFAPVVSPHPLCVVLQGFRRELLPFKSNRHDNKAMWLQTQLEPVFQAGHICFCLTGCVILCTALNLSEAQFPPWKMA